MSDRMSDETASRPYALIGEFHDVNQVMGAAERLRDEGFTYWDVHSPFPIHGINWAMGLRPTILPWIALVHGVVGAAVGLLLVWWTNATTMTGVPTPLQGYQFLVGGKPLFSLPANIPVIFELAILFAAVGTVLGLLGLNKQPMLHNPLFYSERFRRVTDDRFFVVIEVRDPLYAPERSAALLEQLGAEYLELVREPVPAARNVRIRDGG